MNRFRLSSLALSCWLLAVSVAAAQETKTLVTVSFSGYDAVKADLRHIGELSGDAHLADGLEGMLQMMTQDQALQAIDTAKPWGVLVQCKGMQFPVVGFVPIKSMQKVVDIVTEKGVQMDDIGDGVYEVSVRGPSIFVTEKSGYAVVSNQKESLADAPADPLALLGALPTNYDLAVKVSVSELPDQVQQQFMFLMQMGMAQATQRLPDETDEQHNARVASVQKTMEQIEKLLKELDQIVVGLQIDSKASAAHLDVDVTAKPGTETAARFATMAAAKTNFAGFALPGAAVTVSAAGTSSEADVAQATMQIETMRKTVDGELVNQDLSEEKLAEARAMLDDVFGLLIDTVKLQKSDVGASCVLDSKTLTFVAATVIADGSRAEKLAAKLRTVLAEENPEAAEMVKLNVASEDGVNFHTITIPLPNDEAGEAVQKLVGGPSFEVVLGTAPQALYLAGGRDAMSTLKKALADSKSQGPTSIIPAKIVIAGTPIFKYIAEVIPEDEEAKPVMTMIADALEKSDGKDHITLTSTPISNGSRTRIELESGWLKLIGIGIQTGMGGGMPPQ